MPATPNRRRGDPDDSQAHVHRRSTDDDAVLRLHSRLDDHDRKLEEVFEILRSNAENLKSLNDNLGRVADVLETMSNLKGFWLTVKLLSSVSKVMLPPLLVFGALAGAVYVYLKTGMWRTP